MNADPSSPQNAALSAVEPSDEERSEARVLPAGLWTALREDPARAPEHIALAAAEWHGPAAAAWVTDQRGLYGHAPHDLARRATKRHLHYAMFGGAAGGLGGFVTMLPDLASLAWIQSRMVFFVAAAYGFDPRDAMRPAELLVLQSIYATPGEARAALDGTGQKVAHAFVSGKMSRDEALATRLMKMVGKKGAKKIAGKLIPGIAVPINAVGNRRETKALAKRTVAFYGG